MGELLRHRRFVCGSAHWDAIRGDDAHVIARRKVSTKSERPLARIPGKIRLVKADSSQSELWKDKPVASVRFSPLRWSVQRRPSALLMLMAHAVMMSTCAPGWLPY